MSLDRYVNFKTKKPTKEQLQMILEDYLGGIGEIECHSSRWFVALPGKPSFPFRRLDGLEDYQAMYSQADGRYFEVYINLEPAADNPNIDVLTRVADEFTNNVAQGFAELIARYFNAELGF